MQLACNAVAAPTLFVAEAGSSSSAEEAAGTSHFILAWAVQTNQCYKGC